jgi:hypothetical protein
MGVIADKRAQYGNNGGLITGGVLHDALKCVDAAEPHVYRGGTEVGDGSVVPVGDLPLLSDLKLVVGRVD